MQVFFFLIYLLVIYNKVDVVQVVLVSERYCKVFMLLVYLLVHLFISVYCFSCSSVIYSLSILQEAMTQYQRS